MASGQQTATPLTNGIPAPLQQSAGKQFDGITGGGSLPNSASPIDAQIDSLLSSPAALRAHWGISVVDAGTGVSLFARNDAQLFEPASNAKLFTTAAALALLGPAYTFRTTVVAEGPVTADGHLHGTLRLVGSGDPTVSGRAYPYAGHTERPDPPLHWLDDLAAQVAASGIRKIDTLTGDDTLFPWERYAAGWAWDDFQWDYGAPISALTVADNVHYLTVTPGAKAGDPVLAAWDNQPRPPQAAGEDLTNAPDSHQPSETVSIELDPVALTATTTAPGTEPHLGISREVDAYGELRVFGTLPAQARPMKIAVAVREPVAYAVMAFGNALSFQGVTTSHVGPAAHRLSTDTAAFTAETHLPLVLHPSPPMPAPALAADARVVATRTSPPLAQVVTVINKVSQNLHAELLLHTLGKVEGEDGSIAQGVRVVRQFLVSAGIDPQDFSFVDGSGLSPQDLVAPRAATTLLVYANRQSWGPDYLASLPIGGVDGSLASRFTTGPLTRRVHAKTGTLSEVNTLSGYVTAASGRTLAFSILSNDYVGEGSRATIDRLLTIIANAY